MRCAATYPTVLRVRAGAESAGCGPLRAVAVLLKPLVRALFGTLGGTVYAWPFGWTVRGGGLASPTGRGPPPPPRDALHRPHDLAGAPTAPDVRRLTLDDPAPHG